MHVPAPQINILLKCMDLSGVNVSSAVEIVAKAIEIAKASVPEEQQRAHVEDLVRALAAGPDRQSGTSDDIVPPETIVKLLSLVRMGVVGDIVDTFKHTTPTLTGSTKKKRWCCCGK